MIRLGDTFTGGWSPFSICTFRLVWPKKFTNLCTQKQRIFHYLKQYKNFYYFYYLFLLLASQQRGFTSQFQILLVSFQAKSCRCFCVRKLHWQCQLQKYNWTSKSMVLWNYYSCFKNLVWKVPLALVIACRRRGLLISLPFNIPVSAIWNSIKWNLMLSCPNTTISSCRFSYCLLVIVDLFLKVLSFSWVLIIILLYLEATAKIFSWKTF